MKRKTESLYMMSSFIGYHSPRMHFTSVTSFDDHILVCPSKHEIKILSKGEINMRNGSKYKQLKALMSQHCHGKYPIFWIDSKLTTLVHKILHAVCQPKGN